MTDEKKEQEARKNRHDAIHEEAHSPLENMIVTEDDIIEILAKQKEKSNNKKVI